MNSATNSKGLRYSIVIVTYNSLENIRVCLDSLRRTSNKKYSSGEQEIIVVDNDSRDGTPDYLANQRDIHIILNKTNNGFSKACNQGADIAQGKYLIFLNPDTLVTENWTEKMAQYFQDASVGAVGPVSNYVAGLQRLDLNLPPKWQSARSFPGNGAIEIAENLGKILSESNSGKGIITKILIGFCLMIPRSIYSTMGGMDENLFLGNDDLDISWRLRNDGRKLVVASDAFVFHEGQKSFKTEKKSVVDRLTQESTDALYEKLVGYYGSPEAVPSPVDLWGIGWFSPSPAIQEAMKLRIEKKRKDKEMELSVKTESNLKVARKSESEKMESTKMESGKQDSANSGSGKPKTSNQIGWKGISTLILMDSPVGVSHKPSEYKVLAKAESSVNTLPTRPSPDILILNCSGFSAEIEKPEGASLRKLDFGTDCNLKSSLEIALNLVQGTHILFSLAGVQFTTLFNHWMEKRELSKLTEPFIIPLRFENESNKESDQYLIAFCCRKDWLKETIISFPENLNTIELLKLLSEKIGHSKQANANDPENSGTNKSNNPPWLLAGGDSMSNLNSSPFSSMENNSESLPTSTSELISLYPESLQSYMRESNQIGFAGTAAELPTIQGAFQVFDIHGKLTKLENQDTLILRVTPDMVDKLEERIKNLKSQAKKLEKLVVVCNGNQALGLKKSTTQILEPMDLTQDGLRAALSATGFSMKSVQAYRGFPNASSEQAILNGWFQIEAYPRKIEYALDKKVSIVILGFNQVEYTKKCIESILKYTKQKYELILVDNGSNDNTEKYFRSIPGAKVIVNKENLGVSRGWNQGMRQADGDYILILNNDIIVGPNWLENMVRLAESDSAIGLVGPRSNYIAGPQIVNNVPYKNEKEIQKFIEKWQVEQDRSANEFSFIKGFCHLIPRATFEKVGFYDERYGKGNFEDDDYCMRVKYHGYRAMIANDSFIHHYGSVSFKQASVDWNKQMIENERKFSEKWAKGAEGILDTYLVPVEKTLMNKESNPKAKQAVDKLAEGKAAYSEGNLNRAKDLFLAAQGLDPENADVYASLGVIQFHAEKYEEALALFFRGLDLDGSNEDSALNMIDCVETVIGGFTPQEIDQLQKRYPQNEAIRNILPKAFENAGGNIVGNSNGNNRGSTRDWSMAPESSITSISDLKKVSVVVPSWKKELEEIVSNGKYDLALDRIEKKLRAKEDLGECFNFLGIIAHASKDLHLALQHFETAKMHDSENADIIYNLADTYTALGHWEKGERILLEAAKKGGEQAAWVQADFGASAEQIVYLRETSKDYPNFSALLISRENNQAGEACLRSGDLQGAKAAFKIAIDTNAQDFRAENNLGLVAWYENQAEMALNHFLKCLAIRPTWGDAMINAFDTALFLGQVEKIQEPIQQGLSINSDHKQALAMKSHILNFGESIYGYKDFDTLELKSQPFVQAEAAMKEGKQKEAIDIFLKEIQKSKHCPQGYNGLGIIAFAEKRYNDAYGLFEMAASQSPLDQDILLNLWQSSQELKLEREVMPKLKLSLEKNPKLEDIKAIVREFA